MYNRYLDCCCPEPPTMLLEAPKEPPKKPLIQLPDITDLILAAAVIILLAENDGDITSIILGVAIYLLIT